VVGIALINGPYQFPWTPTKPPRHGKHRKAKRSAVKRHPGQSLIALSSVTPTRNQRIEAHSIQRTPARAALWQTYPDNADIGTLFAEAAMDLHPWDLWNKDAPQPWTPEILTTLERVLHLNS
jgi:hypothetical protein